MTVLQTLINLGVRKDKAIAALKKANGDVENAINIIVNDKY